MYTTVINVQTITVINEKKEEEAKVIIFKEMCMQAQTPRKASTMARRVLDTSLPSSQKAQNSHSSLSQTSALCFQLHASSSPSQLLTFFFFSYQISSPCTTSRLCSALRDVDHHHHRPKKLAHGERCREENRLQAQSVYKAWEPALHAGAPVDVYRRGIGTKEILGS